MLFKLTDFSGFYQALSGPFTQLVGSLVGKRDRHHAPGWHALLLDQEQEHLLEAMDSLAPVTRDLLLMHYFQGMKLQEIAEVLDKSLAAAWRSCRQKYGEDAARWQDRARAAVGGQINLEVRLSEGSQI